MDFPRFSDFASFSKKTPKKSSSSAKASSEDSSELSSRQMAIREKFGGFLRAELSSNGCLQEALMDEPREKHELEDSGHPDALVLYRSLVWEGVLPDGFDKEFHKFYAAVAPAAERQR